MWSFFVHFVKKNNNKQFNYGCCVSRDQYTVTKPVVSVPVGKC